MRHALIGSLLVLSTLAAPAKAQVGFAYSSPGVSIGINLPVYPTLYRIPGYPVYYAPGVSTNYFFYDGLYWVFDGDNWYASSWYNGPWALVDPFDVPVFLLRVPVRYYRYAPAYFHGWAYDAAPRWGQHWGRTWESRRSGWDRWDRRSMPAAAPLPAYQRQYSGSRYPQVQQQAVIQSQNYRYQPRDTVVRQQFQQQARQAQAVTTQRSAAAPVAPQQQAVPRYSAREQGATRRVEAQQQAQQQRLDRQQQAQVQRQERVQQVPQQRAAPPQVAQHEARGQGRAEGRGPERPQERGQGRGHDKGQDG